MCSIEINVQWTDISEHAMYLPFVSDLFYELTELQWVSCDAWHITAILDDTFHMLTHIFLLDHHIAGIEESCLLFK